MCNDYLNHLYGGEFDFNNDGQMDEFEQRAQFSAFLNDISQGNTENMSDNDFADLVSGSGVDCDKFGI